MTASPKKTVQLRSRIAPTPSGYLHLGNALNFILTWLVTRKAGGTLKLRIDDADCSRTKDEYIDDIFRQMEWLGLTWDEGPEGPDELKRSFSQQLRFDRYREILHALEKLGHAYVCTCSRSAVKKIAKDGVYPGLCRNRKTDDKPGSAWRLKVPEASIICVNGSDVALCTTMGDFILWRKDNQPSYQLASLSDDIDDKITCIVRGDDLRTSTAAQLFLAVCLGNEDFGKISFLHHRLLTDANGTKLAKSDKALSLQAMREQGTTPRDIYRYVAREFGYSAENIETLSDLLSLNLAKLIFP